VYIGSGIFLLVLGAILSFGVKDSYRSINLPVIGYILMAAGVLAIVLSMVMAAPRRRLSRTVIDRDGSRTVQGYPDEQLGAGGRTVIEREDI